MKFIFSPSTHIDDVHYARDDKGANAGNRAQTKRPGAARGNSQGVGTQRRGGNVGTRAEHGNSGSRASSSTSTVAAAAAAPVAKKLLPKKQWKEAGLNQAKRAKPLPNNEFKQEDDDTNLLDDSDNSSMRSSPVDIPLIRPQLPPRSNACVGLPCGSKAPAVEERKGSPSHQQGLRLANDPKFPNNPFVLGRYIDA